MAELRNLRQNEHGEWLADTAYSSGEKIEVSRTSCTGSPLDVSYNGEKYNDVHGRSRFESPKDEDSDK